MRLICIALFLLTLVDHKLGYSQRIGERISLPSWIESGDLEWVDFNNDALLDIMLVAKDQSGKASLNIILGKADGVAMGMDKSIPIINYQAYVVVDYNRDNKMDLLVSGATTTALYINQGTLEFEEKIIPLPTFSMARFADLDNNASPELIVSGETTSGYFLRILKQDSEFEWKIIHDSVAMKCSSIETFDADGDGDIDLFTSGELKDDSVMSGFLMNEGLFNFRPQSMVPFQGKTAIGDISNDGIFEVVLMGNNQDDQPFGKKYQWSSSGYIITDLPVKQKNPKLFLADFDFDGTVDIYYRGQQGYEIWYGDGEHEFDLRFGYDSKFGDFDHDGKLDAMDLDLEHDPKQIFLVKNSYARENLAPGAPKNAVAFSIFNRVFAYWQKPTDDLTPQASLTYDLVFQATANSQAAEFDLINQKRLTVTHGNNGTNNFKLFKNVNLAGSKYFIQAIDNSFHAGSLCIGGGGECEDVMAEEIAVCSEEETNFTSPPEALWFSFARGFLGMASEMKFSTEKNDTLFYYDPGIVGCASLKTWTVRVDKPDLKVSADHYKIVKGGEVQLHADGAVRYSWGPDIGLSSTDVSNPVASPLSSIRYTVTGYSATGCTATSTVLVTVEETSFIPTLFSPNEDGQNDQLKIFGLTSALDFAFSIFDRDGALVYKSSDVSEVVQRGWDGTKNGTQQPTGIYFWKVRGESSTGKILLNGKDSGSVVLIR